MSPSDEKKTCPPLQWDSKPWGYVELFNNFDVKKTGEISDETWPCEVEKGFKDVVQSWVGHNLAKAIASKPSTLPIPTTQLGDVFAGIIWWELQMDSYPRFLAFWEGQGANLQFFWGGCGPCNAMFIQTSDLKTLYQTRPLGYTWLPWLFNPFCEGCLFTIPKKDFGWNGFQLPCFELSL